MSKNVLSKENAIEEFNKIVEEFNFNISTETKENIVKMRVNNIDMSTSTEAAEADAFISKIMGGRIKYDEDKKQIVLVLNDLVEDSKGDIINEIRFGKFTRAMQMGIKAEERGKTVRVTLNEINFRTMSDAKCNAVLMAMTGISDPKIINSLEIQEFNDLTTVAQFYFS